MMRTNLRWFALEREFLPAALFGNLQTIGHNTSLTFGRPAPDLNRVALGYTTDNRNDTYNPPSLIVLNGNASTDLLSWLRTFSSATSPLTQFARVVTEEDWLRLGNESSEQKHIPVQREDRWACLVLGEALAQADGETEITNIPISIASSCFSSAVARTAIIYDTDEANATCIGRLQELQSDRRFLQRTISVTDLIPAWATMALARNAEFSPAEAAMLVVDAALKTGNQSARLTADFTLPRLKDLTGLFSDSIEERVVTYQKLINEVRQVPDSHTRDPRLNALVAAAAFLVGRGTSHSFLIRRSVKRFTSSFIWYGLIAALAGSSTWDANWSRTVKGIERLLRSRFEWTDPPSADLCWVEYSWLSKIYEGADVFHDIPKMFARGLSIEVVPGATCQLRFADAKGAIISESDQKNYIESNLREKELESTLAQLQSLATKARQLFSDASSIPTPGAQGALPPQYTLGLEEPKPIKRVIRSTRRVKQNPA